MRRLPSELLESLEQYVADNDHYAIRFTGTAGAVMSVTIRGFTIPVDAAFDDDVSRETLARFLKD